MRPVDVHYAIHELFKTVPLGQGENLNTLVTYIERLERERGNGLYPPQGQ